MDNQEHQVNESLYPEQVNIPYTNNSYNPDFQGRPPIYTPRQMYKQGIEMQTMPVAYPPETAPPQSGSASSSNTSNINYQIPPINLYISMDKINRKILQKQNSTNTISPTPQNKDDKIIVTNEHRYSLKEFPYGERKTLLDFGQYLGINLRKHKYCIKYVLEAFNAPLPDGWSKKTDLEGNIYYHNKKIDVVSWAHPTDAYYKELIKLKKEEHKKEYRNRCTIM